MNERDLEMLSLIANSAVDRIVDLGRIKEKISKILDDDIFGELSKHHPRWNFNPDDANDDPYGSDKLDSCRYKFSMIQDELWDIMGIIDKDV